MRPLKSKWYGVLSLLVCCAFLIVSFCLFPPLLYADGGAPNLAYISGTASGISVIDVGQAKITKTIAVSGDPHTILLSQDGSLLYVTQPALDRVVAIVAKTGKTFCTAHVSGTPALLALDQSMNTFYVGGAGATTVNAFDAQTCALRHNYETQNPVFGLALAFPGGGVAPGPASQLWVAGTSKLSVFDISTGQLQQTIALPDEPQYLSIPPGSREVYVTTRRGTVDAVDGQTGGVRQLLAGGIYGTMDYDALSGEVYVPDARHDSIDVLAPLDPGQAALPKEPERIFQLSAPPEAVAITSDGQLGFVAMQGGTVAMLDLLGRQIVYTVPVGGSPHFIITGLYPPARVPIPPPASSKDTSQPESGSNILVLVAIPIGIVALMLLLVLRLRTPRRIQP